jgi:ATP-dependent helicase HrpA
MAALDQLLIKAGGPAWDAVGFDRLLSGAKDGTYDFLVEAAERSLRVLWVLRGVQAGLDAAAADYPEAVSDMRFQIRRMIYPGFVAGLGAERLEHVERYLRAIERRLERLPESPARDAELMVTVQALEAEHDHLQEVLPPSPGITDIAWMLQELRVSLFAQTLGTHGKVSEKRIRNALTEVAMSG